MNTIITFTLKDLLLCGVYIGLIMMLVYIIRFLIKANQSLKNINAVIGDNRTQIDEILKEAPAITQNVKVISDEVAHDIAQFRGTIDNIAETSENVTGVIKDNQSVVGGLTSVFHTASMAKNAYDKFFTKDVTVEKEDGIEEKEQSQ